MSGWYYILIFGLLIGFGASAVWALAWAMRMGEFAKLHEGAMALFDDDETPEQQNGDERKPDGAEGTGT